MNKLFLIFIFLPSIAQSYVEMNLINSNTQQSLKVVWQDNSLSDSIKNTTINTGDFCLTSSSQMNCNTSPMTDTASDGVSTNHNNTTINWFADDDWMTPTFFSWGAFPIGQNVSDWSTVTFQDLGNINTNQSTHLQAVFVNEYDNYINQYNGLGGWQVQVSEVPVPAAAWLFSSALVGLGLVRRR